MIIERRQGGERRAPSGKVGIEQAHYRDRVAPRLGELLGVDVQKVIHVDKVDVRNAREDHGQRHPRREGAEANVDRGGRVAANPSHALRHIQVAVHLLNKGRAMIGRRVSSVDNVQPHQSTN